MSRLNLMLVCTCVLSGARVFAAETNPVTPPQSVDAATQAMANGYLQIQEQLHATQLAIDNSRRQAEAEAATNTAALTARIQALEQTINDQRASEIEAARKTQQLALFMAGTFGLIGLGIMLLMVYFQWRVFTQLIKISTRQPSALALGNHRALPLVEAANELAAPARTAVESSNARLFGVVERLEKRILELEQSARAPLAETGTPSSANKNKNGSPPDANDREECVANLITEGQSLLSANEPQKALECFEVALQLQPKHAEALIKKAGALEKLGRLDDAVVCYDRAIEADGSMTIAYLHKGGLFNRMARYDEALRCYEQALQTQEKKFA
ncbi:MAG: tetratricopeptide repeat protein [Verrucomicrobiota bacterium]